MLASSSSSSTSSSALRSHFAPPPPSSSLSKRKKCTRRRHRKCYAAAAIKGENGEERGEELEKIVTNQRNPSFSFASVTRRRGFAAALSALFVVESSFRPSFAGQVIDSMQKMLDETDELLKNPELSSEEREGLEREKTFFEKQISRVQKNGEFVREQRERLLSTTSGSSYYASGIRIAVRDVKSETQFWETAMGMRVTSRDEKSGVVRLAYGRETLNEDDGGKASIEIYPLDSSSSSNSGVNDSNTNVVEKLKYIQCTVPFGIRVSRVYEAGGELLYGFGYFDLRSPNGIPVIASVAKRRDSLEAVCIESTNVDATSNAIRIAFDDGLDIYDAKIPETKTEEDRKKLTSYVPPPPRGSKFLTALPYQKNEDGLRVDIFPDAATVRANMTFQEKLAEKAEQVRQKAFSGGSDEEDDEASAGNTDDASGTNFAFLGFRAVSNAKENKDVSSVGADASNQWSLAVESLDAFEARVKEQQQQQ
jgi:hypothetical protein